MNKKPEYKFPKGNTVAKDNNNQAKKRIRKSKLRKTEEALRALEPKSLENIEKSVNGDEIDKESLATSKWVIQNIVVIGKAATADEEALNGLRWKADSLAKEEEEMEAEQEKEESTRPRFSTTMVVPFPTQKDLE